MNRTEACKKRIQGLTELYATGAKLDSITCDLLCDIAESLASIADILDGVVKVEQIKAEPMHYAYYYKNKEDIIRCGECKYYTGTYCHHNMQYGLSVTESDYCSKGDRKDG